MKNHFPLPSHGLEMGAFPGVPLQKWGIAKGSSVSWVAKFKGDKISECKLSNGRARSYKAIKLLLSEGKWTVSKLQGDKSASQSSMELHYPCISGPLCVSWRKEGRFLKRELPFPGRGGYGGCWTQKPLFQKMGIRVPVWTRENPDHWHVICNQTVRTIWKATKERLNHHITKEWPEEVRFGPFRSANRTLAIPEHHTGTKIRVFRVCFRAPFLLPFFPLSSPLFPLQALSPLLPLPVFTSRFIPPFFHSRKTLI